VDTVSKTRFARQYASYVAARSVPARLAGTPRLLRHRFRYRIYQADPARIVAKPAVAPGAAAPRDAEIALLTRMTATFAVDGDWDLDPRPFQLHPVVEDLFVLGLEPHATRTYALMREAIRTGDAVVARSARSTDDLDRRFAEIRNTFESMRNHGYRTQARLGRPPGDEISICIGRDGRPLLLRHGNHRLSMAKVLGLTRVPVIIRGVHTGWVEQMSASTPGRCTVAAIESALPTALSGETA
jgi:hypothetical protein